MSISSIVRNKFFIFFASFLSILLLAMLLFPFFIKSDVEAEIDEFLEENLIGVYEYEQLSVSFFSDFPNLSVKLRNFYLANQKDTVFRVKNLKLGIDLKTYFSEKKLEIESIELENADFRLNQDAAFSNYDVFQNDFVSNFLKKDGNSLEIHDSKISFQNKATNFKFYAKNFNLKVEVEQKAEKTILDSQVDAKINYFQFRKIRFLEKSQLQSHVKLENQQKNYKFISSQLLLNQLELAIDGDFTRKTKQTEWNLRFSQVNSKFGNLLSVLPGIEQKDYEKCESSGDFKLKIQIKGILSKTEFPKYSMSLLANNASFHFKDLDRSVENISVNLYFDDEKFSAKKFHFKTAADHFKGEMHYDFVKDSLLEFELNSHLNLLYVHDFYPIDDYNMSGFLVAEIKKTSKKPTNGFIKLESLNFNNRKSGLALENFSMDWRFFASDSGFLKIPNAEIHDKNFKIIYEFLPSKKSLNFEGNLDMKQIAKILDFYPIENQLFANGKVNFSDSTVLDLQMKNLPFSGQTFSNLKIKSKHDSTYFTGLLPQGILVKGRAKIKSFSQILAKNFDISDIRFSAKSLDYEMLRQLQNSFLNSNLSVSNARFYSSKFFFQTLNFDSLNIQFDKKSANKIFAKAQFFAKNRKVDLNYSTQKFYEVILSKIDFSIDSVKFDFFKNNLLYQKINPYFDEIEGFASLEIQMYSHAQISSVSTEKLQKFDLKLKIDSGIVKKNPATLALASELNLPELETIIVKSSFLNIESKPNFIAVKEFIFVYKNINFQISGQHNSRSLNYLLKLTFLEAKQGFEKNEILNLKIIGEFDEPKVKRL